MTAAEAAALEQVAQDRPLLWTRTGRAELLRHIETGVPDTAWDDAGVSWMSRHVLRAGAR